MKCRKLPDIAYIEFLVGFCGNPCNRANQLKMPGPLPPDRAGIIPLVLPPPPNNWNIVTGDCEANFFNDLLAIN